MGNVMVVLLQTYQKNNEEYYDVWSNRYTNSIGWDTPKQITTNRNEISDLVVTVDGLGNAIAAWNVETKGIQTSRYVPGGSWGTVEQLTDRGSGHILIDSDRLGNVMVAWGGWARYFNLGSGWTDAYLLKSGYLQDISFNQMGDAAIAWTDSQGVWVRRYTNNTWTAPEQIKTKDAAGIQYLQIDFDLKGDMIAVWSQKESIQYNAGENRYNAWSSHYTEESGWSAPQLILEPDHYDHLYSLILENGTVVWIKKVPGKFAIWMTRYIVNKGWESTLIKDLSNEIISNDLENRFRDCYFTMNLVGDGVLACKMVLDYWLDDTETIWATLFH